MSSGLPQLHRRPRPGPGSAADYYDARRRRRQARAGAEPGTAPTLPAVDTIISTDNLIRVYHDLQRRGGPAPGVDGLTYEDLGPSEVAGILRVVARSLRDGTYRPYPCRQVPIPKAGGKGHRTLRLATIFDRVVGAALHEALTPLWETIFLPRSYGFRPGRGAWDLLADLHISMASQGRRVLASDDIRNAFDHVDIDTLLDDHRRHMSDPALLDLIATVLRGSAGPDRKEGIDQGGAYSPTALNVRLHYAHDLGMQQDPDQPLWYRYADNLVYLCRSVRAGRQILNQSQRLLAKADLTLKGENPVDLRTGETAQLLGLIISYRKGKLWYGIAEAAWKQLEQGLAQAHETPDPPGTAREVVTGWIGAYGPACTNVTEADTPTRVLTTCTKHGFRETGSWTAVYTQWRAAWKRWRNHLRRASSRQAE